MNRALVRLMNKVNKVTSYHRHGRVIPEQALDDLSNAQLDFEEAMRKNKEEKENKE